MSKKHGAAVREASGLKSPHRLATRSILEPAQPPQQVDRLLKRAAEEQPALEERNGLCLAEHRLVDVERVEQLVRVLLDQVVLCARADGERSDATKTRAVLHAGTLGLRTAGAWLGVQQGYM